MDGFIRAVKILIWRTRHVEKLMIIHIGITQMIYESYLFSDKTEKW